MPPTATVQPSAVNGTNLQTTVSNGSLSVNGYKVYYATDVLVLLTRPLSVTEYQTPKPK